MLGLEPELESRLQQAWPKAITLFNGMRAGLFYRLPQEELTEEDYQLLTDDEKNELRCIGKRVVELMSRDKKSFWRSYDDRKFPVADKAIIKKYHDDISILLLQKDLQVQMDKLALLLEKVCRLKTARAKEEKRKLEEQAEAARIQKERADETAREIAREITRKEKERADEVAKEERRNQAEKTALAEILFNREIRKGLPKDAAKRFADFRLEVLEEITPFTTDEKFSYVEFDMLLNTYLNDVDKAQVGKNKQNIWEWLHICKTSGEGYSRVISDDMSELKKLIVKAFQARMEEKRKLEEQAEAARIQKERAEAFKHVYPDQLKIEAKRYLEKDEQEKLLKAAREAIDGYLKEGKSYLNSYKSPFDYHWLTNKINNKKMRS